MPHVPNQIVSASSQDLEDEAGGSAQGLRSLAAKGFDALLLDTPLWPGGEATLRLQEVLRQAREEQLAPLLAVELDRFALDHPLVSAMPDHFALRRQGPQDKPVDPRTAMPATGEALVRMNRVASGDAIFKAIAAAMGELVRAGAAGFRFSGPQAGEVSWLGDLIAHLRQTAPDLIFIAGPLGERRDNASALARAGCSGLISSFAWWDGRAPWLAEELDALTLAAPAWCEIGVAQPIALETRLAAARVLGAGVIVPLVLASQLPTEGNTGEIAGERFSALRHVSNGAAPVTAILCGTAPDLREAQAVRLVLINTTANPQPVPNRSELASLAAAFDFAPAGDEMLQAGEVRVLKGARASPVTLKAVAQSVPSREAPRLVVEDIVPSVDGGTFAVKRVVGDTVSVEATVFADGHEQLAAELRWRALDESKWQCVRMDELTNDRWRAQFPLERLGRHEFVVEGWLDRFGGFRRDFRKKLDANVAQEVDHAEGRALIEQAVERSRGKLCTALKRKLAALQKASGEASAQLLLAEDLAQLMDDADDRPHRLCSAPQLIDAERLEARFSSWYELFPRSMSPVPEDGERPRHGTFADVIEHLPRVRAMGFDTLYFPPIHPIGTTNRKGPNNTLTPEPGDPGSPYAIGGKEGGHDAIHPELGTFADFDRLVAAAHQHGLEIALDFAIQASPDHPWLKEHPGWFAWRPDGSMKYAENPPKKYQDIVNVDFYAPDAVPALWEALRDVILTWVDHGVKTFRVDNPHTKPLPFWEWLIADVRSRHPDAIFLSEAFTRPTMMYRLAKVGFSQSYTYFTWRDSKHELAEYITELTTEAHKEFYRPHFFVNTPDINPFFLQTGGRAAHRIRAVLAATLSGLWGIYSGFELCDARPLGPGKEEYLDSEKYEIRPREWRQPGDIVDDITLLNRSRKSHPALQTHLNTRFYVAHDDATIWFGKPAPGSGDTLSEMIMVMVNMDPHNARECDFEVPLWEFGLPDHASIAVEDLVGGHRFDWHGKMQHIRLTPDEPYRIWRVAPAGEGA